LKISNLLFERGVKLNFVLDEGGVIADGTSFIVKSALETPVPDNSFGTAGIVPFVTDKVALIAISEKGYACVDLIVSGAGGHSSTPPIPETPVTAASCGR